MTAGRNSEKRARMHVQVQHSQHHGGHAEHLEKAAAAAAGMNGLSAAGADGAAAAGQQQGRDSTEENRFSFELERQGTFIIQL